ncbi:hypothetical protein [Roseibium sp. SCP14]|uniref:hypothetical protein n=1 Tax=Roseibium sp. SCP14 TaxID=3141375 RepID=UPI0033360346
MRKHANWRKAVKSILSGALLTAMVSFSAHQGATAQDQEAATTIEYVTFKAADGVDEAKLARVAVDVNEALTDYDGFIDRHVALQDDGTWVEVVYWRDLDSAKAALDKFLADPNTKEFLAMVDPDSVKLSFSTIKK